jgi:acetolactate synthase-1/2/3 large subunit
MGYGLPAAIGAQLAHKDATVICISGDASFQMNLQELGTIAQYNLPVKIFILNNKWQGMVRQWQQSFYEERYSHSSMREGMPDFVALANSYGIRGFNLNQMEQLLNFDENLFTDKKPLLINFDVREDENCYPMVAPGKSNSQMLGLTNEASVSPSVKRSFIS